MTVLSPGQETSHHRVGPGFLGQFIALSGVPGVRGLLQPGHVKQRRAGDENPPPAQKLVLMLCLSR